MALQLDDPKRTNPMPEKSHVATPASFHRRMDEATKAGIGAALCSVIILVIVLLSMQRTCGSFWTFSVTALIAPEIMTTGKQYFSGSRKINS
jgi:hypothetical protein